jgi:hypothetical protein
VRKFKSKYGGGDVKKYYPKVDVAFEVPLRQTYMHIAFASYLYTVLIYSSVLD